MIGFGVPEFTSHPNLLVTLRSVIAVVVDPSGKSTVRQSAVINVNGLCQNFCPANELDLLHLPISQSCGPGQIVEMVIVKSFFGDDRGASSSTKATSSGKTHSLCQRGPNLVHVSSHQFDFGVLKCLPALIVHCDPADEINQVTFLWRNEIVLRFPSQTLGDVAHFGVKLTGSIGLDEPMECRLQNSVIAKARKERLPRKAELQLP